MFKKTLTSIWLFLTIRVTPPGYRHKNPPQWTVNDVHVIRNTSCCFALSLPTRLSRACNGIRDSQPSARWYVLEAPLSPRSWHLPRSALSEGLVALSSYPAMQAIPGLLPLFLSLPAVTRLVSCLLGKVTDILSSSGLALSRVEGLCVWKRGTWNKGLLLVLASLLPCSFFWVHFKVYSEDLQDLREGRSPTGTINEWEEFSYTNRKSDLQTTIHVQ